MTQSKNDSINSILQHSRVVDKTCFSSISYFKISIFHPVPRQCKWKIATTYLPIRTKSN